ncbi:MAG TPA: DUF6089 family protein [Puia sp.]|jgi:hypothetical protein|nr:DUF6089 family protein [Puia sp.]
MKKLLFGTLMVLLAGVRAWAQEQAIVQEGEIGISAGAAQYFGDLNPNPRFNTPNLAVSGFFRKNFNNYVALRVAASYAFLAYSDKLNGYNEFMYRRNLSFNSNIWELSLQGDFNFLQFIPGSYSHRFTPYITFGMGIFNYNPYTFYQGQKIYLRQLGTEGQGSAAYPDRKPYGSMAVCFPFGVGFKYALNARMNIGLEVLYRFTTTDYIDDVSKTYAPNAQLQYLPNGQPTLWYALQDRSYETGEPIGIQGRQRGYSNQKDSYLTGQLFLSFNLTSYKCPAAP